MYIAGKNIVLSINGTMVGCIKSTSFNVSTSTIDATTQCDKDANGVLWQNLQPNINSITASGNGLQPFVNSGGTPEEFSMQQLLAAQFAQQTAFMTWEDEAGQFFYGVDVIFTSTNATADITDEVSFDFELQSTGPVTTIPVS